MSNVAQFFITEPNCIITTGDIMPLAYDGVTRSGYLPCNGAAFAFDGDYSLLFSVIGYTYGQSGTHFRVPDLRDMTIRGWGGNAANLGVLQGDSFENHTHYYRRYGSGQAIFGVAAGGTATYRDTIPMPGDNNPVTNHETRARTLSVNWAIRYI